MSKCSVLCAATLRVAGSLQKSTEVMQAMQSLVRVPEVAATMRDLSKEMMRVRQYIPDEVHQMTFVMCFCIDLV